MKTNYRSEKEYRFIASIASVFCMAFSASAQLSFTSGVNPLAGPNANYAAALFYNFSNAGGMGEFSAGTPNNLGNHPETWGQQVWGFNFTYSPADNETLAQVFGGGIGASITIPSAPANELQILMGNTGAGDLILTLTSINSVANGGVVGSQLDPEIYGGTENFAPGTTFSAANGNTLQAYLDNTTLFSSGFTLNGTITLDAPANSTDYGNNFGSEIEFNLANVPNPPHGRSWLAARVCWA
jgi:hypothetical protein